MMSLFTDLDEEPWLQVTVELAPGRVGMHQWSMVEMATLVQRYHDCRWAAAGRAPDENLSLALGAFAVNVPCTRSWLVDGRWTWAWQ